MPRCIIRRCSVRKVRFTPEGFTRLACEFFTKPSEIWTFYDGINIDELVKSRF
jgi:hypothetical protein